MEDQKKNVTLRDWRKPLSLLLWFAALVLLDGGLRFFYRSAGSTRFLDWRAFLFTGAWCLLLTSMVSLLPRLARRIAMGVIGGFFMALTLVHGVLFHVTGEFFTFSDMNFAGDGARFFSWTYLRLPVGLWLCLLGALVCLVLGIWWTPPSQPGKRRWPGRVAAGAAAAASLGCVFWLHNAMMPRADSMWWGNIYDPHAESQAYKEYTDTNRVLLISGLYQYTVRDFIVSFGLEGNLVRLEELDNYYEERAQETGRENEMTGAFAGKNLIMVMMESVDTWLVTPDYMPNLYRLQQQGIDLARHYTPLFLSASTFNTEFISQTGLLPTMTGLSSSAYSTNQFPFSLAHLFAKEGYTVNSFHSASPDIYSRGSVHANLGFEAYHNAGMLGMDDYMLDSQMVRGYDQIAPEGNFFSFIITYSGHGPYTQELRNISDPHLEAAREAVAKSGVTGSSANLEEYTLAVAHAMETDQFVGGLVDALEADGRLEDTVLLFYTDHYGKYMSDKEFLAQIKGVDGDGPELYRTPCFFYAQGMEPQTVEKYVAAVDLAPTIANLFDLDTDGRYYAGDDVFGPGGGVVLFPDGGWYDGTVYYEGGAVSPEMEERTAWVRRRERASFDTLRCDYFAQREIS